MTNPVSSVTTIFLLGFPDIATSVTALFGSSPPTLPLMELRVRNERMAHPGRVITGDPEEKRVKAELAKAKAEAAKEKRALAAVKKKQNAETMKKVAILEQANTEEYANDKTPGPPPKIKASKGPAKGKGKGRGRGRPKKARSPTPPPSGERCEVDGEDEEETPYLESEVDMADRDKDGSEVA